jgi:hypothetical protein
VTGTAGPAGALAVPEAAMAVLGVSTLSPHAASNAVPKVTQATRTLDGKYFVMDPSSAPDISSNRCVGAMRAV